MKKLQNEYREFYIIFPEYADLNIFISKLIDWKIIPYLDKWHPKCLTIDLVEKTLKIEMQSSAVHREDCTNELINYLNTIKKIKCQSFPCFYPNCKILNIATKNYQLIKC